MIHGRGSADAQAEDQAIPGIAHAHHVAKQTDEPSRKLTLSSARSTSAPNGICLSRML